jgi:uncharacterized protein YciW
MSVFDETVLRAAGVAAGSDMAKAVMTRANILGLTQAAEDAVLRPVEFGAFAHDLRAALAARVARLGNDDTLAAHYLAGAGGFAAIADPQDTGMAQGLADVVRFVDRVANQTRDIVGNDIAGLQAAGIGDADIVRLCELVAFLAYQIRVVGGLRLMQGAVG